MDIPAPEELLVALDRLPEGRVLLQRLPGGEAVYLVGGAVRDLLRGVEPRELDLVVEGNAISLGRELGGFVLPHERFGTSRVRLAGHNYDIASARTETYERPGALPDIAPATLAEDLTRRDFTINAMALALEGERAGTVQALPGALEDLDARTLRVLHDRSFVDDPTRLLRLARYAGRLKFAIEPRTYELARDAVRSGALATVSGPRVGAELRLIAHERDPLPPFAVLRDLELDSAIHPRFGVRDPALATRALALLPPDGRPDLLVLAAAGEAVPADELSAMLDELAFDAGDRDRIVSAASEAQALAGELARARTPAEIAAVVAGRPPELVALAGGHGAAEAAAAWLDELRHVRLEIGGQDLLAAGVPQGPQIGRALRAALAAKLDGTILGREAELSEALRAVR
jgi:tRNA nucleotidyltransferase (CCA-adding enzyme)